MNSKGQFSIIAALLVALVLVGAVVTTYSAIRYSAVQEQPQILSVSDETNLAVKEMLGFTVGYYGSVLKVTGNQTYAQELATDYLSGGLINMDTVNPEWGLTINVTDLELGANWFSNQSYSQGNATVTYDLKGLGMTGVRYSASIRLDVQILEAESNDEARLTILTDDGKPLINLGKSNFNFHRYDYETSTWGLAEPDSVVSYADGTYLIDLPENVFGSSYDVEVKDNRGLMVIASSYNKITSTVTWNSTGFGQERDYVDNATAVIGSHSDFAAQQEGPDSVYDTLTEAAYGVVPQHSYPTGYTLLGSTTLAGGTLSNLQSNNGVDMSFHAYVSGFSGSGSFGYQSIGSSTQSIENSIRGSYFNIPTAGEAQSISVYVDLASGAVSAKVKAAIYSSGHNYIAGTQELTISSDGWYTFNISDPKPVLTANTDYILVAWSESVSGDVLLHYRSGSTNQGHTRAQTYGATWPSSPNFSHDSREYSIYCNYVPASQYTAQIEFTGASGTSLPWIDLLWAIDGAASTSGVSATFQLYDWVTGYSTSDDGFMTTTLGTSDSLTSQLIVTSPERFVDGSGNWKIMITAVKSTSTQFDLELDLVQFSPEVPNYTLDLREQWFSVNASNVRQDLCIKTGTMDSEPLIVQLWYDGSWHNLMTLTPNYFNNVSLAPYIESTNLTIRFVGSNDETDPAPDSWDIDCVFIKDQPDVNFLINLQESTFTLEVLQNGTMRWLGQNMESTTETLPIPPVPVKAIHINQTINGVNQEVPFQIEDWASEYQIPLGLTSNTTVFSNRQMIVFLLDYTVTSFTIWWDGSDTATQTPMAFTNRYFTDDNPTGSTLTNGKITLQFGSFNVKSTVVGTTTYSTADFMRINLEESTYGAGLSYVIHHGIVRDIVQQEAEWGTGGADGCPNLYANIILTLPANATYYTYQLRLMFINSSQQRTITNLCPIRLTTSLTSVQTQTENGTLADFPIVQNGTGAFIDYSGGSWTAHHFSQFIQDAEKGAGIMFTDALNQKLYAFDSFPSSTSKGAINVSSGLLELLPVSSGQVQFTPAYDITWYGAVATFDGTTPICSMYDGTTPAGLWLLVEYPPTLTVTAAK